jgi:hypothetical protein
VLLTLTTAGRVALVATMVAFFAGACSRSDDGGDRIAAPAPAPTSLPVTTTAAPGSDELAAPALAAATTCRQLLNATEPQLTALLDALMARAATLGPADLATVSMPDLPEFQRFAEGTANLEAEAARVNCTDAEQRSSVCDVLSAVATPQGAGGQLVLQLLRSGC